MEFVRVVRMTSIKKKDYFQLLKYVISLFFFFFLSRIKELFPFLIDHILNVSAIKDK